MLDAHPPFQIDGNFGGAAGILEMLVRDRPQCLELLPALPDEWPSGMVDGVRLRGCLQARLAWAEGRLKYARFTAGKAISRDIGYGGTTHRLEFQSGQTREIVG
jgi:alpha-L-fucosidase 2